MDAFMASRFLAATAPRGTTTLGLITAIWRMRNGEQVSQSSRSGVGIAYARDNLLAALLVQFAAGAIAQVFANQFERDCGIGDGLLGVRNQHPQRVFGGDSCNYGGFFCGHFLSLFLGCGRQNWIVNVNSDCGGLDDYRFAPGKIVDAHLVTEANSFNERTAQIRGENGWHECRHFTVALVLTV